jgi:mannobiose 2-epimerase
MDFSIQTLKKEITQELIEGILPFWSTFVVREDGKIFGEVTNDNVASESSLGGVQMARLLWTFSAIQRTGLGPDNSARMDFLFDFIREKLYDKEFGGTYWHIKPDGTPVDPKKQIYAIAFTIYGLVEYYQVTRKQDALDLAITLFHDIEKHSFDNKNNGYYEAYSRNWGPAGDIRLSEKDEDAPKTMNTHLHVLEAYTTLYSVWKDEFLGKQLRNLTELFIGPFLNTTNGHFDLFFDDNWNCTSKLISYGHDIETAWLIEAAAEALGDKVLVQKIQTLMIPVCDANLKEGIMSDGSMIYESEGDHFVRERHWWVQAEAMVGFYNAYQYSGKDEYLQTVLNLWKFIKKYIKASNGEWYWGVDDALQTLTGQPKAGFWKCPYHNSRACMELIKRIQ